MNTREKVGQPPESHAPTKQEDAKSDSPSSPKGGGVERMPYYYGSPPAAYGGDGRAYGAAGYGMPYYGGGGGDNNESGDSLLGSLTFARMLRVVTQKWPTLVVAVLLGLGGGFAYYKTAPVSYRAVSTIEMHVRPGKLMNTEVVLNNPNTQGPTDEIFNTRLAKLRSREVIQMVAERVRADHPNLKELSDEEMYRMLYNGVEFNLQRRSRLVQVIARHENPVIAQGIANAYATTAETFSMEENKEQAESGVAWLMSTAESQKRMIEKADDAMLDFRVANKIDVMENEKRAVDQVLQQLYSELARSESEQTRALELLAVLNMIQNNPERVASLPEIVPRAAEIAAAQQAMQDILAERDAKLMRYTENHPEVQQLNNALEVSRKQYLDAVWRARETAAANLDLINKQTESLREKTTQNEELSSSLEQKIVAARLRMEQLDREREVSDMNYRAILRRMEEARLAYDENAATIKIIEEAAEPRRPISPDPRVAFTTGPVLGLVFGFLFILLLDRLEDRITGSSDIERHMSTKVLALIPHVPRVKRNDLITMSADKKFSRIAEAFAGLRGLLESPRYRQLTQAVLVVSTQPEEGKTVTSCNLAATYALSGQKTLLVDFDLRRPRIGRMFQANQGRETSLMDVLATGKPELFDKLPQPSGYDHLDLIVSRPSAHHSPANVMGADIVPRFFAWARERYDRIIVDSPPFGLVSDAVVLGTLSDSVMLVCRPDRSRYRAMRHAIRQFIESGAKLLGVVVNDVDFGRSAAFSNYDYHQYGYGYRNRYGRYGYGYGYGQGGYYKRDLGAMADEDDTTAEGDDATAPAFSVLDVDDDE